MQHRYGDKKHTRGRPSPINENELAGDHVDIQKEKHDEEYNGTLTKEEQ